MSFHQLAHLIIASSHSALFVALAAWVVPIAAVVAIFIVLIATGKWLWARVKPRKAPGPSPQVVVVVVPISISGASETSDELKPCVLSVVIKN